MGDEDRWRGGVEAELRDMRQRLTDAEKAAAASVASLTQIQIQLAQLRTQVGVWSAVGGVFGAAIATALGVILGGAFH